ncbi:MAG: choice-of-anchor D domain-containing protein [Candidatus Neomarinimicrobiota bacterium]|nr:choice-of-anchor D domain-containing protein [Candidatus Neomarinimicrobiota bacterium]
MILGKQKNLILNLFFIFVFVFNGILAETVVFTKADSADWTIEENQDRITDNVWITRKHNQSIFNIAVESGYSGSSGSPVGTLWSNSTSSTASPESYTNFVAMHGGSPSSIINDTVSLYLPDEGLYFDVTFTSYSGGPNGGGGFSYSRTSVTPSLVVSPDSLSADLNTGETITQTLTLTNSGDSNLNWEIDIDWITMDSVTFVKENNVDHHLPVNQDRITDDIWITREQGGAIFNIFYESQDWHPHNPAGTEWAAGSFDDIGSVVFETFGTDVLGHSIGDSLNNYFIPNNLPLLMHLIDDDVYYEVYFHSWQLGNVGDGGGGFSYTRVTEPRAIHLSSESGTVAAGSSFDVDVMFDASGMYSGDYYANITISSNDTSNAQIVVPAHLSVTGSPNIWVEEDTLDFGEVFVNYSGPGNYGGSKELRMGNNGTDILNVSSITVDNTAFTISQSSATLDYGEITSIEVSFMTDDGVGSYSANITIVSDDSDEGTITIPVIVDAVEPPVLSAPDSISAAINVGDSLGQSFTLSNTGVGELTYELDVIARSQRGEPRPYVSQANPQARRLPFDGYFDYTNSETRQRMREKALQLSNDSGNNNHSETNHTTVSRDNNYTWELIHTDQNNGTPFDLRNIYMDEQNGELLFKWDSYESWDNPGELLGITFIYIDVDQNPNTGRPISDFIPYFNIGAEIGIVRWNHEFGGVWEYQYSPGFNAWISIDIDTLRTNYMVPYGNEAIIGVKAGWFDGSSGINFGIVVDNAIGDDNDVDLVPSFGTASYITYNFKPNWLSFDLPNGVIPTGSSQDIIATFNGSAMLGGEYFADINVATNDPITPQYTILAHMSLTGIPNVFVENDAVDFGISYLDFADETYLKIHNNGTGVLEIQNITTDSENITVSETSLDIDPLEMDSIELSLVGTDLGDFSANVTITSNDPDNPTLSVPVTSTIVLAPNVGLDPGSFILEVESGASIVEVLTISNSGGSNLEFDVEVVYDGGRDQNNDGEDDFNTDNQLRIEILTDNYPEETSWVLYQDGSLLASISQGSLNSQGTLYTWDYEVPAGEYRFVINDAYSDGICCGYGNGEYNLYLNDELIATGGQFGSSETVEFTILDDWLTMNPLSGTVSPEGSAGVLLNINAAGMDPGVYSAGISVNSNDPDQGAVIIPLSLTVNGMSSENESLLPAEFALHQNYPNPFNPQTRIRYDLPENSMVNITVYDMLGREVKTLVNQVQNAGFKSIIWDATNDYGKAISAGIYLYQIQAGDYIHTQKMVLLK